MIGVIARADQKWAVEEFFELFKTPWEHYRDDAMYDVIVATDPKCPIDAAKVVILYTPEETFLERGGRAGVGVVADGFEVASGATWYPVYGPAAIFSLRETPVLSDRKGNPVGWIVKTSLGTVVRVGYDLFDEVDTLLRRGQPEKYAQVPTLDIHIDILRRWILDLGLSLVEIPPTPYGYDFITCLTHDIDFMGIKDHKFDHTALGFIYRSIVPAYLKGLDWKTALRRYGRNLKSLLSLPFVQMGLIPDFWYPLERYAEAEKGLKSTFFFIPFSDRAGEPFSGKPDKRRAARYQVAGYTEPIRSLVAHGSEVGLHGIDAWMDPAKGREEIDVIRRISGQERIGVRMHWLHFSETTPERLAYAGVYYDSTLGYNGAVGFRSGTRQVFRLPGAPKVFELPLHIQDTAMLYPGRMGLTESRAKAMCFGLIDDFRRRGGVLTVNWHDRSLSPERNWGALYAALLDALRVERTWFATAGEAVSWFEKRRAARFDSRSSGEFPDVRFAEFGKSKGPPLALRVHRPARSTGRDGRPAVSQSDRPLNECGMPTLWN